MIFTKKQAQDAMKYASQFSTDLRSSQARKYMTENNITKEEYKKIVINEIKKNRNLDQTVIEKRKETKRKAQQKYKAKTKANKKPNVKNYYIQLHIHHIVWLALA